MCACVCACVRAHAQTLAPVYVSNVVQNRKYSISLAELVLGVSKSNLVYVMLHRPKGGIRCALYITQNRVVDGADRANRFQRV